MQPKWVSSSTVGRLTFDESLLQTVGFARLCHIARTASRQRLQNGKLLNSLMRAYLGDYEGLKSAAHSTCRRLNVERPSFIQGRLNASSHRTISAAHWLARKQFEGHPSALGIAGGDFLAELRQGHHSTPGDEL